MIISDKILELSIVTPKETAFIGEAEMVIIPAMEGELGILIDHAPLVSMLQEGVLKVYNNEKVSYEALISQGYAQIFDNKILILTDTVLDLSKIELNKIEDNLISLREKLTDKNSSKQQSFIEQEIARNLIIQNYLLNKNKPLYK